MMGVVASRAALYGHMELLQWLEEDVKWLPVNSRHSCMTRRGSSLERRKLVQLRNLTRHAASHGHLEILKWLHTRGIGGPLTHEIADVAARHGQLRLSSGYDKSIKSYVQGKDGTKPHRHKEMMIELEQHHRQKDWKIK